jgi:hypothetical protein
LNNLFKDMLAEHFEQEIYDFLQDHIMNNYDQYDLTRRANEVNEVLEASLDLAEVLRVYNIKQDGSDVAFNMLVSCDIEIGDYFAGENITESVCQWFELSCSAVLENATLTDFSIDGIEAYNK